SRPVRVGRRGAPRLLVRDARRHRVRHLLVGVRGQRHGARHLDRARPPEGHRGRIVSPDRAEGRDMTRFTSRSLRTALALAACLAAAGCSKKPTAPNSLPRPEGEQNGAILLMGWREQASLSYQVTDPGTPNDLLDDFLSGVTLDYWSDPRGARATAFDV